MIEMTRTTSVMINRKRCCMPCVISFRNIRFCTPFQRWISATVLFPWTKAKGRGKRKGNSRERLIEFAICPSRASVLQLPSQHTIICTSITKQEIPLNTSSSSSSSCAINSSRGKGVTCGVRSSAASAVPSQFHPSSPKPAKSDYSGGG